MAQSRETDKEKTLKRKEKYGGEKRGMYLENYLALGLLPTPVASDCKGAYSPSALKNKSGKVDRTDRLLNVYTKISGHKYKNSNSQLNLHFVGEMMGFPDNWLVSPFIEGEKDYTNYGFNNFPSYWPVAEKGESVGKLSFNKHREEAIKGYGNAVVPQVVLQIFKSIQEYEKNKQI